MNKDEFEKQYDEVLREFGFTIKTWQEKIADKQGCSELDYVNSKKGTGLKDTLIIVLFCNNSESIDIELDVPSKRDPPFGYEYYFKDMSELIAFLPNVKRGVEIEG